jgi:predicted ABC-type ATPase
MLEEIASCAKLRANFAFETTLSGVGYLRSIEQCRAAGYHVSLLFLSLPDAETAIARVALRVEQGGHFVPEPVIRRRFARGLRNCNILYKQAVDDWALYDNTGPEPVLLEWGENP